jgi:hypothetical protein
LPALSTSRTKANLLVRSPPGPAGPVSCGDRISRLLTADRHEQAQLALFGTDLGQIEVAERIAGEALLGGLGALDLRQPADPVSYQAAV